MKTAENFKKAVEEKGLQTWTLRECGICSAPLKYIFAGGEVFYDNNCDCVNYYTEPQLRSYGDLADHYNRQTNEAYIKELNEFWGFKD